jgi:hypothetical protein
MPVPPEKLRSRMKNVLAFLVTVFVGVAAGSILLAIDAIESDAKKRGVSTISR